MEHNKEKEITVLLDLHPEMYDRILQLLRSQVSDLATTQEQEAGDD